MADVQLSIGGHSYTLACADGEEDQLRRLGALVAEQVQAAKQIAPGMAEARQLLFAAIFLADKLEAERSSLAEAVDADTALAASLNASAQRIEALSEKVANLTKRLS